MLEKIKNFFGNASKRKVLLHALVALALTVLAYNSIEPQQVTTWVGLWEMIKGVFSNPYLLGLCIWDVISAISDNSKGE